MAESFFATLKNELVDRWSWATLEQLTKAAFAPVEGFYNSRLRTHMGLTQPRCCRAQP